MVAFMRNQALVVSIDGSKISVIPLISDACINCNKSSCSKRGTPFTVLNSQGLPIKVGSKVLLSARIRNQATQGIISLLFPVATAIAGFFLINLIGQKLGQTVTEGKQALCVLICLALSSGIVLLNNRHLSKKYAEITEIV